MKILNFFYSALVFRLREGHICAWLIDCVRDIYSLGEKMYVYFYKNKLHKYVIIRFHNLKLDTEIVLIEPL